MDEESIPQTKEEQKADVEFSPGKWLRITSGMSPGRFPDSGYSAEEKGMSLSPGEERLLRGKYFINYGVIECVSKDGTRFAAPATDDRLEEIKNAGYQENPNLVVHYDRSDIEQRLEFAKKRE